MPQYGNMEELEEWSDLYAQITDLGIDIDPTICLHDLCSIIEQIEAHIKGYA